MSSLSNVATLLVVILCGVADMAHGQEMECYGSGSIAGAVIGTLIATLVILAIVFLIFKKFWKPRKEKHLVLETDPEKGDAYAFDNPGFKDAGLTPIGKTLDKSVTKLDTGKHKWSQWSPLGALVSTKNEKKRTVDDSCIEGGEVKFVSLRSHDFTGLGFNIYGNMREGIFIKDVLHRGPASESGKLSPGDRINSLRISFEHMVYEDALTILSYASPYEVEIEAKSGVKSHLGPTSGQGGQPIHPIYRSSSSTDLFKIGKSARSRLFHENLDTSTATEYSTLQLSTSNDASLERSNRKSPLRSDANSLTKPERIKKPPQLPTSKSLSPEQLKSQLEQNLAHKISNPHEMYVTDKNQSQEPQKIESEMQNSETDHKNRFSKFGIRVLPMDIKPENLVQPTRSPKSAELSQNDNNINLEKNLEKGKLEGVDEVDKTKLKEEAPPVKRREKPNKIDITPKEKPNRIEEPSPRDIITEEPLKTKENFERQNSLNGSGIKRDKAGIPQEIPEHMMNAAVAARKNRKSTEMIDKTVPESEDSDGVKSPKKPKGKAPAPPPEPKSDSTEKLSNVNVRLNFTDNFDEIRSMEEKNEKSESTKNDTNKNVNKTDDSIAELKTTEKSADDGKEYCSDSDMETDNQSSVNTIELNSSDITIHHSEDDPEIKGRKTASTGDLSKIHKARKTSTGTLERAQSLDITDSGIPTLTKKRKASKEETEPKLTDSDESLYEKSALKNKEPRLSLALDGLDTFQRNRLKKSSEWGNLEDAIMTLDKMEVETPTDAKIEFSDPQSPINFDFGAKNTEFGTSVTKINDDSSIVSTDNDYSLNLSYNDESLTERLNSLNADTEEVKIVNVQNQIWPPFDKQGESVSRLEETKLNNIRTEMSAVQIKTDNIKVDTVNYNMDIEDEKVANSSLINSKTKIQVKNQIWPTKDETVEETHITTQIVETIIKNTEIVSPVFQNNDINNTTQESVTISTTKVNSTEPSFSLKAQFQEKLNGKLKNTETSITEPEPATNVNNISTTNVSHKTQPENITFHPGKSSQNFIFAEKYASSNDNDNMYNFSSKLYDTNVSDDIKVSRHSLGSLERPKSDVLKSVNKLKMQNLISSDQGGVSNITITENKQSYENGIQNNGVFETNVQNNDKSNIYDMSSASELYTTAIDSTLIDKPIDTSPNQMNDMKNITITETNFDSSFINESPSSLTIDTSSDGPESIKSHNLTYVTEIQVSTPSSDSPENVSEVEVTTPPNLLGHQEIKKSEEVFKRLPEMKFSTSSYESPKTPEKRMSQIELLRSNFEKSPPKPSSKPVDISPSKSRIPVATSKVDFKMSPERREIRFGDLEMNEEREIIEIMSSAVHSTPMVMNQRLQNKIPPRNVTVTSIRTSSKIPSGSHISGYTNKPPVPARPTEHTEEVRTSNGSSENFKHWVFNPGESSVTSIVVENKESHK